MAKKIVPEKFECKNMLCAPHHAGIANQVYGLGFVGALIYSFQHAANSKEIFFGILKAILWPAMLVYQAFLRLGL